MTDMASLSSLSAFRFFRGVDFHFRAWILEIANPGSLGFHPGSRLEGCETGNSGQVIKIELMA